MLKLKCPPAAETLADHRRGKRIHHDGETLRGAHAGRAVVGHFQREVIGRVSLRDERAERERAAVGVERRVRRAGEQREGQRLRRLVGVRGAGGKRDGLADVHGLVSNRS